nr:teichoic acid D-Ala incorporation-associated protein DltX [uncultured Lactobacillus sp.]
MSRGLGDVYKRQVIYCVILMLLIYLYQYSGLTSVHFIYNEF